MPRTKPPKKHEDRDPPRKLQPPTKSKPGDRARHRLTPGEAKDLAGYARRALKLKEKKRPPRGEKRKFADLEAHSGMRHETLLKWARVADAFGPDLEKALMELGKTKLYVLAYHPDPRGALDEEVVDQEGRTMTGRTVDAESLRLHIRRTYPERRRKNWFRKHQKRPFKDSLKRALASLRRDVERVKHRITAGANEAEHERIRKFRDKLKSLAASITKALDANPPS